MIKSNLTEGSVFKKLVVFAVPFLLSNFLQAIYSTVDLFIVSWYSDPIQIAAVTVGSQIMTLITNVLVGFSIGITILTALYVGGGNSKKVGKMAGTAIVLFFILSITVTAVLILSSNFIVNLMNVDETAKEAAAQYLNVSYIGIIFIVIYNVIAGMYRGAGITRPMLIFVFISGILNLILDIYFVKNLNMGAYGAAVATVIAQALSCAFAVILLIFQRKKYEITFSCFKPDRQEFKKIVKLGLPTAIQQFTIQISFVILMGLANSCGLDHNIAYGYVTRVSSFAILPLFAILSSISSLVGQNIGAQKTDRALKAIFAGMIIMMPMAILMFAAVNIFAEQIYGFFAQSEKVGDEVIAICVSLTRFISWEFIAVFPIYALHGFVNGTGKTTFTMFNSFLSSLIVRIPLSYLLFHFMGFNGIGLAIALSPVLSTIVALIYVFSGKWKPKTVLLNMEKSPEQK